MPQTEDKQPDGYYGDDTIGSEEIDLSFLDEDEEPNKQ